jgi:predicted DNA-binding transcriptional regulator YafY
MRPVLDTSARLLRLLSLLQSRPDWGGPELADRLGVTTRTVRRDVDRLRQLGYPVDAAPGADGGYRLGTGASLPPLLLDDDEATAVAVALGASTGGAVRGIEEPALAALAKLDRLLPPHLRGRVQALREATVQLPGRTDDHVDADVLVTAAQACAGQERLVLTYEDREGRASERRIEPHRLVATGRRWYLVCFDLDRRDWRTFRVDRISAIARTGHRFRYEDPPPDAARLVSEALAIGGYRYTAVVRIDAPAAVVRRRVPATVGVVEDDGPERSVLTTGGDDLPYLAAHLVELDLPLEVLGPPELREFVRRVARRLSRAHPARR